MDCRDIITSGFRMVVLAAFIASAYSGSHSNIRMVAGTRRRSTRVFSPSASSNLCPVGMDNTKGRPEFSKFSRTNSKTAFSCSNTANVP